MTAIFDDPLTTAEFTRPRAGADRELAGQRQPAPLPLQSLVTVPAERTALPEYRYDPVRQLAVNPSGEPLEMGKKGKDWTSYDSTHTDGDGGDNETWGWEEQ